VVAVAGHCVDPAELGLVLGDDGEHCVEDFPRDIAGCHGIGVGIGLFGRRGILRLTARRLERRKFGDSAAPESRCVGRRGPQGLELVVQPRNGQRRTAHVETGHDLTDLGQHYFQSRGVEQWPQILPEDEQFLVFRAAETVQNDGRSIA
jgi:hypothetical protein